MNRLKDALSPYLLEHAKHPVDWQPWDEQALEQAKKENKPIFLSIGYAANHMCHVMARESFTNHKVAKLLNQHFVAIKVDREERPDIDRIYQKANQMLNRTAGGWPLTMFLDPHDHIPIFGGTYFPPQQSRRTPGIREVLRGIAGAYGDQPERMEEFKKNMREALEMEVPKEPDAALDALLIDRACGQIDSSFDAENGGFNELPKMAHVPGLEMMLDVASATDDEKKNTRLIYMVDFTLAAMSRGGLFDHVGGGFHTHSVDEKWTIPRFEKMLYDNAMLLPLYARRAIASDNGWFNDVANRTAEWLLANLQLDNGAFGGSLDADLKGDEGRCYYWLKDEVKAILEDDYDEFAETFGLTNRPNFTNYWHLRRSPPAPDGSDWADNNSAQIARSCASLLAARNNRGGPARDEKVLTAWNALAIRGLARFALVNRHEDCAAAAIRALDYIKVTNWRDGQLFSSSLNGKARQSAFLDDYAYLIEAVFAVSAMQWRSADIEFACRVADAMLENFEDPDGGFYFTAHSHESLIQRSKPRADETTPSGNGSAIRALISLGRLIGEPRYLQSAERALQASLPEVEQWPSAHATIIHALQDWITPRFNVVIRAAAEFDLDSLQSKIAAAYSRRTDVYVIAPSEESLPGRLGDCAASGEVTVYVNQGEGYQIAPEWTA